MERRESKKEPATTPAGPPESPPSGTTVAASRRPRRSPTVPAQRRPCSMTAPATRSTLRKSIVSRFEDSYLIVTSQEREQGTSLNSDSLAPKPLTSSVYVRVPEALCPRKRSILVMSLFPSQGIGELAHRYLRDEESYHKLLSRRCLSRPYPATSFHRKIREVLNIGGYLPLSGVPCTHLDYWQ